jgi:serine protease Do
MRKAWWASFVVSVALAGLGPCAAGAQAPAKKDQPGKRPPALPAGEAPHGPGLLPPNFEDLFWGLSPAIDPDEIREMQAQMERVRREMQRTIEQAMRQAGRPVPGRWPALGGVGPAARPAEPRLGVRVRKPSETLVDQLDLPRGQGLVLEEVGPNSPAARAGLKAHDILLELAGKPVPSDVGGLRKLLADVKANTPIDAVVLRKGRKETIKGLSLPEARAAEPADAGNGFPAFPGLPRRFGAWGAFGAGGFAGNGVMTTTWTNDRFTTRHQEGDLSITITGRVAGGRPQVTAIRVEDGGEAHRYASVDEVPGQYRDKVKDLLDTTGKANIRFEIRTP